MLDEELEATSAALTTGTAAGKGAHLAFKGFVTSEFAQVCLDRRSRVLSFRRTRPVPLAVPSSTLIQEMRLAIGRDYALG